MKQTWLGNRSNLLPRKPQRRNGREKYNHLLDTIEQLLAEREASDISLADISDAADVPTASVYHFFPNRDAAIVAVAERLLQCQLDASQLQPLPAAWQDWQNLVAHCCDRALDYFSATPTLAKLRFGPKSSWEIRNLIVASDEMLADLMLRACLQHFRLPEGPDWRSRFALAITICSSFWSLSYTRHGSVRIADAAEARHAAIAYLRTYLGEHLPPLYPVRECASA